MGFNNVPGPAEAAEVRVQEEGELILQSGKHVLTPQTGQHFTWRQDDMLFGWISWQTVWIQKHAFNQKELVIDLTDRHRTAKERSIH